MDKYPEAGSPAETNRLLSELDQAIDQSSAVREIINCYQRLHDLERITGPTAKTRLLRKEIKMLEHKLKFDRDRHNPLGTPAYLPG